MSNGAPWSDVDLRGAVDFHVHTAPDSRPRWHSATELADLAASAGMAGFVVKDHHASTVERAAQANAAHTELRICGGITLNREVGGIDPAVVADVLAAGGRIVWLPSKDGRGERGVEGIPVLADDCKVIPELREIFQQLADADAVLATGHISAEEVGPVVSTARSAGVRKIIVNHPEIPFLSYSVDLQRRLRDAGAILERCYPRPEMEDGFDRIAQELREVGVQSSILATDLGRADLPAPLDGFRRFIHEMLVRGFDANEIDVLTRGNPLALLNS